MYRFNRDESFLIDLRPEACVSSSKTKPRSSIVMLNLFQYRKALYDTGMRQHDGKQFGMTESSSA